MFADIFPTALPATFLLLRSLLLTMVNKMVLVSIRGYPRLLYPKTNDDTTRDSSWSHLVFFIEKCPLFLGERHRIIVEKFQGRFLMGILREKVYGIDCCAPYPTRDISVCIISSVKGW